MFLFEYFWTIVVLGSVATALLLLRAVLTESEVAIRRAVIVAAATASWAAASAWIVTPREQIETLCETLGRLADEGNVPALEGHLAAGFHAQGLDREAWIERVGETLTHTRLDHVRLHGITIEWPSANRATVVFGATCNIRRTDGFESAIPTRWRLHVLRHDGRWLVETVESIPIPPLFLRDPLARYHGHEEIVCGYGAPRNPSTHAEM